MDRNDTSLERPVADALRTLKHAAFVPPVDPAREAALLEAFDAAHAGAPSGRRRDYWYLGAFAAAAALFLAASLPAVRSGKQEDGRAVGRDAGKTGRMEAGPGSSLSVSSPSRLPGEFVIVPGAAGLPPMESGTLVRMDVPVSVLPSLGVTPPPGHASAVTADLVVAQDGLPRAVRLVSP